MNKGLCGRCSKPKGRKKGCCKCGRPVSFSSPSEMKEEIIEYFENCYEWVRIDRPKRDDNGNIIFKKIGKKQVPVIQPEKRKVQIKPLTIQSLVVHLGTTFETLSQYEKKKEFSETIKRAKDIILANKVERLNSKEDFTPGIVFDLKNNHQRSDKQEVEHSGAIETIVKKIGVAGKQS